MKFRHVKHNMLTFSIYKVVKTVKTVPYMKIKSSRIITFKSICFFLLISFLILACSKDSDVLEAVLLDETTETIFIEDAPVVQEILEQRFKSFPPIHDAHVQSGRAFNQNIMRLEQDSQIGYLMFDLSPIAEINGIIKAVTLQVTIKGTAEQGVLKIFQGASNEWSEASLTEASAPNLEVELGSIETQFASDDTEYINLQFEGVNTDLNSLILTFEGENSIALATKEHEDKIGPKLVVTYEAPEGAAEITLEEENAAANDEASDETESNEEETEENGGEDEETEEVTENNAPIAVAEASPLVGILPLTVNFQANKSTDNDSITTYLWDFKDGGGSSNINPSNTFTEAGTYAVSLTVTDSEGLSNTKTVIITVNEPANEAPVAIASSNVTTGEAPLTVVFTGAQSTDDRAIVSYSWNFLDGSSSNETNPTHTFQNPGTYLVEFTVTDASGLTDTDVDTIVVTEPISYPEGYYVAVDGTAANNGLSPSSPWSIEHAFSAASAGDIVYVKAGNYGNQQLTVNNNGSSSNPIKFIGYTDFPGDITTSFESTFNYGDSLDSNKMPLLVGNNPQGEGIGTAINVVKENIHIENFQITNYNIGIDSYGEYCVYKNIIATNLGDFNPSHSFPSATSDALLNYKGVGIVSSGDYTQVLYSFILNAGAEGIRITNSNYQKHLGNKVYSDNNINPTDYYYIITNNSQSNEIKNIYIERVGNLEHFGHGLSLKVSASKNKLYNCVIKNTVIECSFSNVYENYFENCKVLGGADKLGSILIANGAHHNIFESCTVENAQGIAFSDWDDGFASSLDQKNAGNNNSFNNCVVKNSGVGIDFNFWDRTEAPAHDNTFTNCQFLDLDTLFKVNRPNYHNVIEGGKVENVQNYTEYLFGTTYGLFIEFENTSFSNNGFSQP